MTETDSLARARSALERHAWSDAFEVLAALDRAGSLGAEDLERLGEAAWWSAHPDESLDAFERAYAAYVADGDRCRSAGVAIRLGFEYADRLDAARWNAWLGRATRAIEDDDCVERGFVELANVRTAMERGALDDAMQHATAAHEIGVRLSNPDLIAFGLVLQGGIRVFQGDVETGLSLVDEGTLSAVDGELTPYVGGSLYCVTLGICRSRADYRRASEWTEAAARWCERQSITGFPGVCRVQRAEIMRLRGALDEAEDEARAAQLELTAFGRLPQAGAGAYEIGEVRLRRGDLDGAEAAFAEAHRLGHEPEPGIALLWLARGRLDAARSSIATALADAIDPADRARILAARAEIAIARHDLADAREAAEELGSIAAVLDAPIVRAAAAQALGEVSTREEDPAGAIAQLRAAVREWTNAEAPFETARARRSLAIAYRLAGDDASAMLELAAARSGFESLGARLDVERCDELIRGGGQADAGRRVARTFVFTDIVGSTDLIQTIGDEAWNDVLRWHDETLRTLIASHGGEVVHSTGDGFFAAFREAAAAVSCAVAIQRRLAEHRRRHGFAPQVRIGVHAAEATSLADDYAGLGVHAAARVSAIAGAGEILATVETATQAGVTAGEERTVPLKGIADPVRVVGIEWREP